MTVHDTSTLSANERRVVYEHTPHFNYFVRHKDLFSNDWQIHYAVLCAETFQLIVREKYSDYWIARYMECPRAYVMRLKRYAKETVFPFHRNDLTLGIAFAAEGEAMSIFDIERAYLKATEIVATRVCANRDNTRYEESPSISEKIKWLVAPIRTGD